MVVESFEDAALGPAYAYHAFMCCVDMAQGHTCVVYSKGLCVAVVVDGGVVAFLLEGFVCLVGYRLLTSLWGQELPCVLICYGVSLEVRGIKGCRVSHV